MGYIARSWSGRKDGTVIFVVLGMHKSGTTLVSQILHHSGINMDDHIDEHVSYDRGNKYERQAALNLNIEILGARGYEVLDLTPRALESVPAHYHERVREIVADCTGRYQDWGFKDPRTCLTYPVWASALPEHKLIVIFRDPREIWPRFRPNRSQFYLGPHHARMMLSRWREHNVRILEYIRDAKAEVLILRYRDLMTTQEEFDRLQTFVGRKLIDRRNPALYRSRARFHPSLALVNTWNELVHRQGYRRVLDELVRLRQEQIAEEQAGARATGHDLAAG